MEFAPGLFSCWAPIGDCLEGHEIGVGSSVSILCLFFWFMSSSNGRFTCCFYFSSDMYSSGEFEFDLSSSPGCLGGVLAKPEPFLIKLFPKSYLSGLSEIFFLA